MRVTAAGDLALLVDLGEVSTAELHAAAASVRGREGVRAVVVGHQSLLVVFDGTPVLPPISTSGHALPSRHHAIPVCFDGPDLHIPIDALRSRDLTLTARYLGFRAGFAYLDGWPAEWRLPRRATSRTNVPAGSFAIAGEMAGFYPVDSPGGWNLLGRTDAVLWDPDRDPPNLIDAGDTITIVPVDRVEPRTVRLTTPKLELDGIDIVSPGQQTQLLGPPDWSRTDHGLPPGGVFDPDAATLANRAVGNEEHAPVLECVLVGPRLRFRERRVIAWYGAACELPSEQAIVVQAGEEIAVGRLRDGIRGWLAIGTAPHPRFGHLLPVTQGEGQLAALLPLAPRSGASVAEGRVRGADGDRHVLRVIPGPHITALRDIDCEVTPHLDRVGIRLRPLQPVGIDAPTDLPSCGMQCGTVQLHADGSLVTMGPDHPITGGYLQPLTVIEADRWKLAQLAPGERVRLAVLS